MPYVEHPFVCLFSILERILEMAVKCHRFCMHCVPFIIYIALPGEQFVTRDLTEGGIIVDVMDHKRLNIFRKNRQGQRILNTWKFASC